MFANKEYPHHIDEIYHTDHFILPTSLLIVHVFYVNFTCLISFTNPSTHLKRYLFQLAFFLCNRILFFENLGHTPEAKTGIPPKRALDSLP